jgi:hypothetical protein
VFSDFLFPVVLSFLILKERRIGKLLMYRLLNVPLLFITIVPENRAFVGKDKTVLSALAKFLNNADQDVVFGALEVIHMLSQHQGRHPLMTSQISRKKKIKTPTLQFSRCLSCVCGDFKATTRTWHVSRAWCHS